MVRLIVATLLLLGCYQLTYAQKKKVLFIGNSITYFNNMPFTFEAIANSKGDSVEVVQYAPGGTGFVNHVADPNVYAHFKQENWDFVILQPGSNESPGFSYAISETITRGKQLQDSIYKYSPCAKIVIYEIAYGIVDSTQASFTQFLQRQALIKNNITEMADSLNVMFAPVGESFLTSMNTNSSHFLWGNYFDIHPNAKGSYLAACTFYATLFNKPSLGTPELAFLSNSDALYLQGIADQVTLTTPSDWRIGTYNLTVDFQFLHDVQDSTKIQFTSLAQNYDSLYWNFGDQTHSTLYDPLKDYTNGVSEVFDVYHVGYKNGCSDTVAQHVTSIPSLVNSVYEANAFDFHLLNKTLYWEPIQNDEFTINLIGINGNVVNRFTVPATNGSFTFEDNLNGFFILQVANKYGTFYTQKVHF